MAAAAAAPPSVLLPHVDELVMEYLLFRGFTKSFQVFSAERKRDRAKGFDVEQVIAQLLELVQTYQVDALLETWKFLAARFFNHLDASYAEAIQSLETSLLRLYVVNAIKTGHREKAAEFFQSFISAPTPPPHANKLNATIPASAADVGDSWCRWFILPYLQQPESDAYFQVFFSKEWLDAFLTSFRNFLTLIFRNLALPKLLAFQLTRLEEPALKMRLKVSQSECTRLRLFNVEANARIRKLEDAGRQLHKILRRMVQHSYFEHFARGDGKAVGRGGVEPTRSHSNSSAVGFSPQQLQELGELFGIRRKDRIDEDATDIDDLTPPVFRTKSTRAALRADDHDREQKREDPDSPAASSASEPSSPNSETRDTSSVSLSLVRRIESANGSTSALSIRPAREQVPSTASVCRISCDGKFVASATLTGKAIAIHSTAAAHSSSGAVSTIRLLSPLRALSWIASSAQKEQVRHVPIAMTRGWRSIDKSFVQVLLFELADGTLNAWGVTQQRVVSRLTAEGGGALSQLVAAASAPLCLLLTAMTRTPKGSSDATADQHNRGPRYQVQIVGPENASSTHELVRLTAWHFIEDISCVACDSTLSVFATGSRSGRIQIFDSKLRHPVLQWRESTSNRGSNSPEHGSRTTHDDAAATIQALAFSPDGTSILSISAVGEGREIFEWACSTEALANAGELTSTDSSDNGFRDADSSRVPHTVPRVVCSYLLGDGVALPDANEDSESRRFELKFHPSGRQFVLATHWRSRLTSVQLYTRGDPHPSKVDLGGKEFTAFDWWQGASPPLYCTSIDERSLALWKLKNA